MRNLLLIFSVASVAGLAACSSVSKTPASVKEQAKQGVSLLGQMETSLKAFRDSETASETFLNASTAEVRENTSSNRKLLGQNQLGLAAAGNKDSLAFKARMETLLVGLADNATSGVSAKDYMHTGAQMFKPFPSTAEASTATQEALAPLTTDLPKLVTFKEWAHFAKAIHRDGKDLEAKIKAAKVAAPTANP